MIRYTREQIKEVKEFIAPLISAEIDYTTIARELNEAQIKPANAQKWSENMVYYFAASRKMISRLRQRRSRFAKVATAITEVKTPASSSVRAIILQQKAMTAEVKIQILKILEGVQ